MHRRKLFKDGFAARSEGEPNLAAILFVSHPPDIMLRHQPIGQTHGAVMADLQPLGHFADGDPTAAWKALDGQHRLVLLRGETRGASGVFAEMQELPQCVAELGQRLVVGLSELLLVRHAFHSSAKARPIRAG